MPTMSTHTETGLPIITEAALVEMVKERLETIKVPLHHPNVFIIAEKYQAYVNTYMEAILAQNPLLHQFLTLMATASSSMDKTVQVFLLSQMIGLLRLLEIQETLYQKE